jgi:hypothetical protein
MTSATLVKAIATPPRINEGKDIAEVLRHLEVSESSRTVPRPSPSAAQRVFNNLCAGLRTLLREARARFEVRDKS